MATAAEITAAIHRRAKTISRLGAYIGFFEWVAWAVRTKVDVQMLFGSNVVDVKAMFAPDMPQHSMGCLRVAAVLATAGSTHWRSAVGPSGELLPHANHFVIGISCGLKPTGASSRSPSTSAVKDAMRAGWILRPTESAGNCGIDVMCHHLGRSRDKSNWAAIRADLANFCLRIAGDPAWHQVFVCCQELTAAAVVPWKGGMGAPTSTPSAWAASCALAASGSGGASSSSGASPPLAAPSTPAASKPGRACNSPADSRAGAASSCLVASEPGGSSSTPAASMPGSALSTSAASLTGVCASSPAASQPSSCSALPPLPPPPLPPPFEGPLESEAVAATAVAGPRAFAEWVRQLPLEKLREMTLSVTTFVQSEADWRAAHPKHEAAASQPRRKNLASHVNFKYATGLDFLDWRQGAGRTSRAPHKD